MKTLKNLQTQFVPVLTVGVVMLAGNAMASGFGHVEVTKEKDTFLLTEQVKIGTSVYGSDLSRPAGLYMRFNQAPNNYTSLFDKYLTVAGASDTPQAIIPGANFNVTNFNLDCSNNGACLLNFPAGNLGIGDYSLTFFLADATKPVQVTPDSNWYFFTQDNTELPITTIDFTIAEGTCNTCSCATFAAQNPCMCDAAYASSHPTECKITATTIVGSWNTRGSSTTSSFTGNRQYLSDNTFTDYELLTDGKKYNYKGDWTYDNSTSTLSYKYTDSVLTNTDGTTIHCWTTTWPSGKCDNNSDFTFASGTGTVQGTAQSFTISQANGWVITFTRQ